MDEIEIRKQSVDCAFKDLLRTLISIQVESKEIL